MASPQFAPTARTTVKRLPARANDSRDAAYAVLDEGLVAHVGIEVDGQPFVIPMVYGRHGDRLVLHGSVASRLTRGLDKGLPVCVTVTLVDGLVMARSAFHHSMNYRSVMVLGVARRLTDPAEARQALLALVDHVAPGRAAEVRDVTEAELRLTTVLELDIEEASMKQRVGDPVDDPEDLDLPIWAGVLPLAVTPGPLVPAADLAAGIPVSASLSPWTRGSSGAGES